MLKSDEALASILDSSPVLDSEFVPIASVAGRVAAENIQARLTQPPFKASAMDGYGVRFADMVPGAKLKLIGETRAGKPPSGRRPGPGEAVRVFTGSVIPDGVDHIIIQEHVSRHGESSITIEIEQFFPRNIRAKGVDFTEGDILVETGKIMHEIHASLLASANLVSVPVIRKPRLSLFSCGDELVEPGSALALGQIINSNHYALSGLSRRWGAKSHYRGCTPDKLEAITSMFDACCSEADIILVTGGASVGDYDYVKPAFVKAGGKMIFENIAIKPGKPIWFGELRKKRVLGLPGNPASAIVGATLFLRPLIYKLSGRSPLIEEETARLDSDLPANTAREAFLRARLEDEQYVTPAPNQDSSLLSPFASANVLIRRPANASALAAGRQVPIIRL